MLAGTLRWLVDALYWFMVVIMLPGSVLGTFQWIVKHSRKHSPRVPDWLGPLYFWSWVAWAAFFAQLLVPQVFSPWSLVDLYRGRDLAWLLRALTWFFGAIAVPAALLFTSRWILASAAKKRKEQAKNLPWNTFDPIGHRLNWNQIFSISAVAIYDQKRDEPVRTTVGRVLNEILPGRFNVPGEPQGQWAPVPGSKEFMGSVQVATPSGRSITVANSNRFAAELVDGILQLFRITEHANDCVLFFYEHDDWYHDTTWGERYKFFVVHQDNIVLEDFALSRLCDDFFEPSVLRSMYDNEDRDKDDEAARDDDGELTPGQKTAQRWWYRRFYTETRTGQIKAFWNEQLYNYVTPERREDERDARLRRVEFGVLGIAGLLVAHYVFKWF